MHGLGAGTASKDLEPRDPAAARVGISSEVDEVEGGLRFDERAKGVFGCELVEAAVAYDSPLPFLERGEEGAARDQGSRETAESVGQVSGWNVKERDAGPHAVELVAPLDLTEPEHVRGLSGGLGAQGGEAGRGVERRDVVAKA